MNKFENFEGVELANDLDEGELVKKAQEWGSKLWEILAKEGGEKGDRDCEATNNKKSGSRTCQTLKVLGCSRGSKEELKIGGKVGGTLRGQGV